MNDAEDKEAMGTQKPTMDEPQEEFIGEKPQPSVTEKELRQRRESKD